MGDVEVHRRWGEWGYGVGEREGCYGSCRGGTGLCIEGFGMLLGGKGGGRGGGWVGGCDGRDSILPPFVRIFSAFSKAWEMGFLRVMYFRYEGPPSDRSV